MLLNIPEGGLDLESSAKAMAGLPTQAFAITLSDGMLEDMIECVQNGQNIQLSLGSSPVSNLPSTPNRFSVLAPTHLLRSTISTIIKDVLLSKAQTREDEPLTARQYSLQPYFHA